MPTTRYSALIALLVAVLASGAGSMGCATPTLPLPPPAALTSSAPDVDGLVTLSGEVLPEAYVFCLNLDQDQGVIVRSDTTGAFTLQIPADAGNYLSVWQELGTDSGPPLEVRVPAPMP